MIKYQNISIYLLRKQALSAVFVIVPGGQSGIQLFWYKYRTPEQLRQLAFDDDEHVVQVESQALFGSIH